MFNHVLKTSTKEVSESYILLSTRISMVIKKIVLTGGPCSGKTTLIDMLEGIDFMTLPEVVREIITQEVEKNSGIVSWNGKQSFYEFQNLVEKRQKQYELQIEQRKDRENYFLDRGIIDSHAYCKMAGINTKGSNIKFGQETGYIKVFLLEALNPNFYAQDLQRKEDYRQSIETSHYLQGTYENSGIDFEIISNKLNPQQRLEKILKQIK